MEKILHKDGGLRKTQNMRKKISLQKTQIVRKQ